MSKLTDAKFTIKGNSGTTYSFNIYHIDEECPDESGIYIFTRRDYDGNGYKHKVVYIGMAQSFEKRFYAHHKDDCIDKQGANCICLMQVPKESDRKKIELDLLGANNTPCNEHNN